mmetsp:Transcript_25729/g.60040  ORF Transcript_25729/g.60040 Transcript_25729/m.60040 type:complete len:634 (+) Transcript_25729:100-2001(+)
MHRNTNNIFIAAWWWIFLWCTGDALRPSLDVVAEEFKASPASASATVSDVSSKLQLHAVGTSNSTSSRENQQGWAVLYLTQASTSGSNEGEDGAIVATRMRKGPGGLAEHAMSEISRAWRAYSDRLGTVWDELQFVKTVWVAPTKGAIGSALIFYAYMLSDLLQHDQDFSSLPTFEVIAELRPFQRWTNIQITGGRSGRDSWSSKANEYYGRPRAIGGFELNPDLKSLDAHLRSLIVRVSGRLSSRHEKDALEEIGEKLWTAATQMMESLKALLPPDIDIEDDGQGDDGEDPLRPPENAKEVYRRIHKIKTRVYQLQYEPPHIMSSKAHTSIGRILMIGDPITAIWMFPSAMGKQGSILPESLSWGFMPTPAPMVMFEAHWSFVKDSSDGALKAVGMPKKAFKDVKGVPVAFEDGVPYWYHINVWAPPYESGWKIGAFLSIGKSGGSTICLDDSDIVLPELSRLDVEPDLDGNVPDGIMPISDRRSVMPGNTRFHSYFMTIQSFRGGFGILDTVNPETWPALVYINSQEFTPDEKVAFIAWVDLFGASPPNNFVDLAAAECEQKEVGTGVMVPKPDSLTDEMIEEKSYHIELTAGGKKWQLTPVVETEDSDEDKDITADFKAKVDLAKSFIGL